jgi:hypothetical protein
MTSDEIASENVDRGWTSCRSRAGEIACRRPALHFLTLGNSFGRLVRDDGWSCTCVSLVVASNVLHQASDATPSSSEVQIAAQALVRLTDQIAFSIALMIRNKFTVTRSMILEQEREKRRAGPACSTGVDHPNATTLRRMRKTRTIRAPRDGTARA